MTQQVQHVPRFLPWIWPLLLTQCINPDVHLYYAAFQNLVYKCGNVPQTTVESSDTPSLHCAQNVKQPVDMSVYLPTDLQCDPAQMAEIVEQEYVLIGGA